MAKKTRKPPDRPKPQPDKFRTHLEFDSREAAAKFHRSHPLLGQVAAGRGAKGALRLTFHLTLQQIGDLEKDGYAPEVAENISDIGRERQKEVGKGDRFEGGKIPPAPRGVPEPKER